MTPNPSAHQEDFTDCAKRNFKFLLEHFGFTTAVTKYESRVFAKEFLEFELGWYKGEVDASFNVLLENNVFRPYVSRRFYLGEVVRRVDANAFVQRPSLPRWALSVDDADCFLQYYAELMQKFCLPILQGDLSVLEAITHERRAQDKANKP